MKEIRDFFSEMADEYDAAIESCVPQYREMLARLLEYIPLSPAPQRICELGCGTGNLSRLIATRWPSAALTLVDVSPEMLDACRSRFRHETTPQLVQADFCELRFEADSFDLILSSISIHHLNHAEKEAFFQRMRESLRPGGLFSFSDQMAGVTPFVQQQHMQQWRQWALDAGTSLEQWESWMTHQDDHDHHESYPAHAEMLSRAGFAQVDCLWRHLLWTIVQARAS